MNWTEKYRPKNIYELVGNEEAILNVVRWIKDWFKGKRRGRGLLIAGPPGIGKTTLIYAIANHLNLHVVELNASDYRTAQRIYEKVGYIGRGGTLETFFGDLNKRNIIIFFDEIDGIDPRADTGGLKAVIDIASRGDVPVIAAANIPDPVKHKALLENFDFIQFRELTPRQIAILLRKILLKEGYEVDDESLNNIIEQAGGDARLAINLLQESIFRGVDKELRIIKYDMLPFEILLERLSTSLSINEIKNLLYANSNQIEDLFYYYYDMVLRNPVIKFEEKIKLLKFFADLDLILGKVKRLRAFYLFKYILQMLPWLIYSSNRAGVLYDGRIPLYRFKLFIQHRGIRDTLQSWYKETLMGRLKMSYRKFIIEQLRFICLNKFKNIDKLVKDYCKKGII